MTINKYIPKVNCQVAKQNQQTEMTDRHIVAQLELPHKGMIDMVAVFDGHHGSQVADELINVFPEILAEKIDNLRNIHKPLAVTEAIRKAILAMDYKMYQGGNINGGSAGVIALWPHKDPYLYIANLGDTRAIVWSDHLLLSTTDHLPVLEVERITSSGGNVVNDKINGIHISRGFGDFIPGCKLIGTRYMGKRAPITIEPEIFSMDLANMQGSTRMLLASNGLWDVMNNQKVIEFMNAGKNCNDLVEEAMLQGSKDNITVLLVDLFKK